MQPPKSEICVLCGTGAATTSEHVPPRGFFKGISGQFITVPACFACNNGTSEDDELLRNYLSAEVGGSTEESKQLWKKGAHKSFIRSRKFRNELMATLTEVNVVDHEGKEEKKLAFQIPVSLYTRIFNKVARGLYFHHTGNILSSETPITIDSLISDPISINPEIGNLNYEEICDGVFKYWYAVESESSLWFFSFHDAHWVMVKTGDVIE